MAERYRQGRNDVDRIGPARTVRPTIEDVNLVPKSYCADNLEPVFHICKKAVIVM